MIDLQININIQNSESTQNRAGSYFTDSGSFDSSTSFVNSPSRIMQAHDLSALDPAIKFKIKDMVEFSTSKVMNTKYIKSLNNPTCKLKREFGINIKRDHKEVIGEIPQLELYAFGDTEAEVIKELTEEIIDLWKVIKNKDLSQLSIKAFTWQSYLQQYITTTKALP